MADLDATLTGMKANDAGQRIKAFKDADEHFVLAVALVDSEGNIIQTLNSIEELKRIGNSLDILIEGQQLTNFHLSRITSIG